MKKRNEPKPPPTRVRRIAAAHIPASVPEAAAIGVDETAEVREDGGGIPVEPVKAERCELDALLDQMGPETFPEEVDFGPPRAREIW